MVWLLISAQFAISCPGIAPSRAPPSAWTQLEILSLPLLSHPSPPLMRSKINLYKKKFSDRLIQNVITSRDSSILPILNKLNFYFKSFLSLLSKNMNKSTDIHIWESYKYVKQKINVLFAMDISIILFVVQFCEATSVFLSDLNFVPTLLQGNWRDLFYCLSLPPPFPCSLWTPTSKKFFLKVRVP